MTCGISPQLFLAQVSCLLLVTLSLALPGQADEVPTRDEVVKALQAWRSSFANLHVVYEKRNPGQLLKYRPQLTSADGWYSSVDWFWDDRGAIRSEISFFEAGKWSGKELLIADGRQLLSFRATYSSNQADSSAPKVLEITRLPSARPTTGTSVLPLMGNWNPGSGEWLADVLERGEGTFGEMELDSSGPRLRLNLDEYTVVWLDSSHSFLPVRLAPPGARDGWIFTVDQFAKTEERGIWYPASGTLRASYEPEEETATWKVKTFATNQRINHEIFVPPEPNARTNVVDVAGTGKYVRPASIEDLSSGAKSAVGRGDPVRAHFPANWWLPISLLGGAIVFALAAVLFARKR